MADNTEWMIPVWVGGGRTQGLKKEGARLCKIFKLTEFGLIFTLKKIFFWGKGRGAHPAPPTILATGGGGG